MEASSFFLTGNHPVRVVSRHHFGRPLMKKAMTLFIEGFIEGWNGSSVKPAGNPQPPKATATGFDVGTHLTAEELDTVFSLLAEPPCATSRDKPTEQAPQTTDTPRVIDVLDAEELADVFRLLAEAPAVPTHTIADTAEDEKTSSIPLFYFPETEETDIEEIDPAYGTWVEMAQQGYCC